MEPWVELGKRPYMQKILMAAWIAERIYEYRIQLLWVFIVGLNL